VKPSVGSSMPKEKQKAVAAEVEQPHMVARATGGDQGGKITEKNALTNSHRRFYPSITSEMLKDPGFRNLTALYIGSFLWDASLWDKFVDTIKLMPRLETLVIKDPLISISLLLESKTLRNFGLYARGLKKMDAKAPMLESMTIVHTLNCGTGFFSDLM